MRFVISEPNRIGPTCGFPTVVLARDAWDDYGYKTMFSVKLHLSQDRVVPLDAVKIIKLGQREGHTKLPNEFSELRADHCSLGQAPSYYEQLKMLGPEIYAPFLSGLKDIAYSTSVRERFRREPGIETSLLRFGGAARALEEGMKLFGETQVEERSVSFRYEMRGGRVATNFDFGQSSILPSRLSVVIGYNGAGKTQMLANLAILSHKAERDRSERHLVETFGRFVGPAPNFGAIIAISYSAFDQFVIPSRSESSATNYSYCGLRQLDADGTVQSSLKSIGQLTDEFHDARRHAIARDRLASLREAMTPLTREPSFQTAVTLPDVEADDALWEKAFEGFSTGHKIVLNIVVHLCANLERSSLVLIDEPEMHLHPPLLAALLMSIQAVLRRHDSFGIVATHSPVVVQEVPASNVKVLRRNFDQVAIESPEIETFAENVGLLTKHVFNLDSSSTDYQDVLWRLASAHTLELEALFPDGLSAQARSLVVSIHRSLRG